MCESCGCDKKQVEKNRIKRPLRKSDFEAVLKSATRPTKKVKDEKESEGT